VLKAGGHDFVAMSRSSGVDVVTADSLATALAGVECDGSTLVDAWNRLTLHATLFR
jgi:hypothetical protein